MSADTPQRAPYSRNHIVCSDGLPPILASSDPAFRGDPLRWNPEQLFLASIAQCHMLWYLGLADRAGIEVVSYEDRATAVMVEESNGAGQFDRVTLKPIVVIGSTSSHRLALELHDRVADFCFIARSISTPIDHQVTVEYE